MKKSISFAGIFQSFSIISIFIICLSCQSGQEFVGAEKTEYGFIVKTSTGEINFTAYSASAIEAEFVPEGESNPPSYGIGTLPRQIESTYSVTKKYVEFSTPGISVKITKKPLTISYSYNGKELFAEEKGYFDNDSLKGFRFQLSEDEKLMGGGSRVLGMNRRGNRLQLYNRASYGYETHAELMYYSLPIAISSRKYMLAFDNGASGFMDLGATEEDILSFEAIGGRMSYLVVAADEWDQLAVNFTELTGRQPMVPRWAMGNIASRMGYHSQEEVENVADKYIEDDIPLDAIVLDIYWFGKDLKGHLGNLEWDLDSFPEPEQMMARNRDKGVRTVLITEPFVIRDTKKYQEGVDNGYFGFDSTGSTYMFDFYFGNTALIDIFKPEARKWFWDIYKKHTLSGVAGWWGDLGEPEVHPDDLLHVNGRADHVHNLYGHEWASLIFNGYKKDFPEKRPVILMRSGFIGSQRYGLVPWTGDVNRTWGGLKPQVEISLQMGMQGLAYMHSDLGGFAGDYKDAELYIRWLQYGVFQPIYRTHAQEEVPAEPIFWDKKTKDIVRRFIKLRYELMPYQYTLAYETAISGMPMMRPLFYVDDNPGLLEEKNTYLWGDNFLVSPVTEKGATSQNVYLPKNSSWINFWSGEVHRGGQEIEVRLDLGHIPVFVKAGSFIPMTPVVQSTKEYSSENLSIHYYHDASVESAKGMMYEDDGETNEAYYKKAYEILNFESEFNSNDGLSISISSEGFNYEGKPETRNINLVVHNLQEIPKQIMLDEKPIKNWEWDSEVKELRLKFEMKAAEILIEIK